jgi:hypothetical protein
MKPDSRQRKVVGIYDRPSGADRKRGRLIWIVLALLIALAWVVWFSVGRG